MGEMKGGDVEFHLLIPRRTGLGILGALLTLNALLLAAYLLTHLLLPEAPRTARELFDMDAEVAAPTWFSTVQIFSIGLLLLLSRFASRRIHVSPTWLSLAGVGFIFASADEGSAIHEKITAVALGLDMEWLLFEGDHGAWVSLYLVVGAILLFAARRALRQLWRHHRAPAALFTLGIGIFVAGAFGLEVLSYGYLREGAPEWQYQLEVAAEEFLELSGASVMLYGALRLVSRPPEPPAA